MCVFLSVQESACVCLSLEFECLSVSELERKKRAMFTFVCMR